MQDTLAFLLSIPSVYLLRTTEKCEVESTTYQPELDLMTMRFTLTEFEKCNNRLTVEKLFKRYNSIESNIVDESVASATFKHSDLATSVCIVYSKDNKPLFKLGTNNDLAQLRHIPYSDIEEVEITIAIDGYKYRKLFNVMIAVEAILLERGVIKEAEITKEAIIAKGEWLQDIPNYPIDNVTSSGNNFELEIALNS